jgi:RND family efflux transporter MFP subunit
MNARSTLRLAALPLAGALLAGATAWQARRAAAEPASASASAGSAAGRKAPGDRSAVRAEGRLVARPGADVTVGAEMAATVARVAVDEGDHVRRGQVIAEMRADEERAALAEARARIAAADADIRLARTDVGRMERLAAADVAPQQQLDRARHELDAALARRQEAQAAVRRLEATVAKAVVVSPIDGVVVSRSVQPGERVDVGAELVHVADLARVRVEAEVDEFDAGRVAAGARVRVTSEGYDAAGWTGRVEEIPQAVSARRLRPQDPGRPTDTRVLLVKVALDRATPLKLGQRVEVEIGGR